MHHDLSWGIAVSKTSDAVFAEHDTQITCQDMFCHYMVQVFFKAFVFCLFFLIENEPVEFCNFFILSVRFSFFKNDIN